MNPIDTLREAWKGLSKEQRTVAGVLGAIDTAVKGIALWDLSRTDAKKLRGPKWLWTTLISAVNTFGWLGYFIIGKRH